VQHVLTTGCSAGQAGPVDAVLAAITCQAQGVLMERLRVDAWAALKWLVSHADERGEPVERIAAEVIGSIGTS
jgi:AmiR/NasT family two-component response regulator